MRLPRISVHSVMALVVVAALDCMTFRSVDLSPESMNWGLIWIVVGSLPMAHVLAIGLAILIRRRGGNQAFWLGFQISGGVAFLANLGLTIARPDLARTTLDLLEPAITFVGRRTGLESSPAWVPIMLLAVLPALWLIPQWLVALSGGWLTRLFSRRAEAPPTADRGPRRLSWGSLVALSLLVAIPAMAVGGVRRWMILPTSGRLEAGENAVLDLKIMPKIQVKFPTCPPVMVLDGTKVRVEDDSHPSSMEVIEVRSATPGMLRGDFRIVRITLLEGGGAGRSTTLGRRLLRPLR